MTTDFHILHDDTFLSGTIRRLFVLDFGLFQVHANGRIIGIPGYLIEAADGAKILVDTGFPARYATDADGATVADGLDSFGRVLRLDESNLPPAQLALLGLTPADVDLLIMTHADVDHVGGIADFPHAPLLIGRAERALPQPRYFGGRSPIEWPEQVTYRLIDEDTVLGPGLALLVSPGHAPGHLSLLLRLGQTGPVLITGDAISRPAEFQEGFGGAWDETEARRSADRLMAIAAASGAMVFYGHDPEQWPALKKAPAAYE